MTMCNMALIGISGYGAQHYERIRKLCQEGILELQAVCDLHIESNASVYKELQNLGIKCYCDYKEMLECESGLDFVTVSTPIHFHRKMAIDIMEAGYHVLLEKPPAVTIQDIDEIIKVSERTGKLCAVNFLHTAGKAFLDLQKKMKDGSLGTITTISGAGLWKRLDSYYERTPWAGKITVNGAYVLDGTINNPLAHLLNNMLFLADAAGADQVKAATAELYHAHAIEAEDTSCLKIEMNQGIEMFYYATLCAAVQKAPYIVVRGTRGEAVYSYESECNLLKVTIEGHTDEFCFYEDCLEQIYRNLCAVVLGDEKDLCCPIQKTRNFVLCSNGAFESSKKTHEIPEGSILRKEEENSQSVYIQDIEEILYSAQEQKKLFSECNISWAVPGGRFCLEDYRRFQW